MDAITYRTNDATRWGNGQGADLSAQQIDINFWALFSLIQALTDHLATGGIQSISQVGNQLFITLTDGAVMGPFTLPSAQWNPRGEWAPATHYNAFDVITKSGGLYLVIFAHTSAATFDPNANDGSGHDFYQLLLGAGPLDIPFFFRGRVPEDSSLAQDSPVFVYVATRDFWLPASLVNSQATLRKAARDDLTLSIYKNDSLIGALLFGGLESHGSYGPDVQSDGSEVGTFVFTTAVQFNRGDRLTVWPPVTGSHGMDPTAVDLAVNFAATIGIFAA